MTTALIILIIVIVFPFLWYFLAHVWAKAQSDVWTDAIQKFFTNLKKQENNEEKEK